MTNQRNIASKENTWNKDRVWRGIIIAGRNSNKANKLQICCPHGHYLIQDKIGAWPCTKSYIHSCGLLHKLCWDIWIFIICAHDNICAPGRLTGQYGITDAILAARLQRRLCDTGAGEKLKLDLNANWQLHLCPVQGWSQFTPILCRSSTPKC